MVTELSYFRPMDEYDLKWVLSTEKASYDFPWSQQGFTKVMDDGLAYILCDMDDQALGYACFLAVLDEIHLLNLCISPNFRRQGIALQALDKFKDYFVDSDYEKMLLEVRQSNPAKTMYQKLGFVEDGIRKGYYPVKNSPQKEDAVLMSWALL
ncbi:ribosomal protein S18-alanine N-acetyltransferase [Hydrogenovibrio kuenenii]|uniref:ribosomal protein S18-alanine N-acetyltransferase n=1 Tax=Hydrogenovibrio kuenenii TaxID=63658 RepID=UPI0004639485|nr:ribosomal protein S18-alanine N-acetyltransferase [Hydrogenovibrio kuenenii]